MAGKDGKETRDEILARLDVQGFYSAQGVDHWKGRTSDDGWQSAKCPLHDDREPSFSVNLKSGHYKCFNPDCGASGGGGVFDWLMLRNGWNFRQALEELARQTNVSLPEARPEIDATLVATFHENLSRNVSLLEWLKQSRSLEESTLEKFQIGWDGDRIIIPVFDEHGKLRNLRRYKPKHLTQGKKVAKFLNYTIQHGTGAARETIRYGEGRLFNLPALLKSPEGCEVIICAGEPDLMLLDQLGFLAVTSTLGEGTFLPTWARHFLNRKVTVLYDNDAAGQQGSVRVAEILHNAGIETKIAHLPAQVGEGGDVTDYVVTLGGTAETLRAHVLSAATIWEPTISEDVEPIEVSLQQSSGKELYGKPIRMKVMVSGKDTTPYVVPRTVRVTCPQDGRKACAWCGLFAKSMPHEYEFTERDRETIAFTVASDTQVKGAIRSKFEVARCDAAKIEVVENQNLEEVRLIPELDFFNRGGDEEYVQRVAIYRGQGLRANQSYEVVGYAQSDPRSQYSMPVIGHATPAQDSISSFRLTPELAERLSIFKPRDWSAEGIRARFKSIATDFEHNVHRIYERAEMQYSLDLIWHSVIGFYMANKLVRKGWVEALIMGDSGQGKTEMSMSLLGHYGLGDRVQGEQSSIAGLIGGVEQTSKRWMLTWGKMPLNDRRLIVIEEISGMHEDDLGALSDVRSTGIAEITKMRTERTNARCRLVFLSNPRGGRAMATFTHGVQTIIKLFGKAEDVRRLDFAIVVASGEVPQSALERSMWDEEYEHTFKSSECKNLILWGWSRTPEQVKFTREANEAILRVARNMSEKYSSKIPLVEPADQRIKIARLAAAAAVRTFSTNEDGEGDGGTPGDPTEVLVRAGHVEFIESFLTGEYDKRSMGYDDYSRVVDSGERLSAPDRARVIEAIQEISGWKDMVHEFRKMSSETFRKSQFCDMVGWDKDESRKNFRILGRLDCVFSTPGGFRRSPFFNDILRDLASEDTPEEIGANGSAPASPAQEEIQTNEDRPF